MRQINKVAVLGAGVMGATIAGHLANAGLDVLLLDVVPNEPNEAEKRGGLTLEHREVRNRLAQQGRDRLLQVKPSPLYLPRYLSYIEVGNFEDDMPRIGECDWVIEVVLENLEVKTKLLTEMVVPNLKRGAILSSNTSGLSINIMAQVLPAELRRNFLVTHFFNPPRYMRLMELVPCSETDPETLRFLGGFLAHRLGKGIVHAKDTPNFIANRIGTYAGAVTFRYMVEMGLTVPEVDSVTGPPLARPKTATFALWDLVGIDTVARVCANSYQLLEQDEERDVFRMPEFIGTMVDAGLTGKKAGQGFYKRETVEGKSVKFYYDYRSGAYEPVPRPQFASVAATKQIDDPAQRLRTLLSGTDRGAEFAWKTLRDTLLYTARRIPEISEDVVNIDNAMKWGYNWELGPFEILDAIGVAEFVARAAGEGCEIPATLAGVDRFYKVEKGTRYFWSIPEQEYREIPRPPQTISLTLIKSAGKSVEQNSSTSLLDLGDGVFGLEFHSKMNTIGAETLASIQKAIQRSEQEGIGLVIANEGGMFSAGANLMLLAMGIVEGEFDEISRIVQSFQKAMMAIKYSKVPVVAAPHQMALGGGCETCLHADSVTAHAETYMGLVEIGVGILPAGGGTKEMAIRAITLAEENGADVTPFILRNFRNIAMAKVSSSAAELFELGYLRRGDSITMDLDKRIYDSKLKVISLAANYRPSRPLTDLKAPGRSVAASIKSQLWNLEQGGYISAHDRFLAGEIASVITGGDVPAGTPITEQYLLDLEREAFLRCCSQKKSLERIQHMLKTGRALRN